MQQPMLYEETAAEVMKPIPAPIPVNSTAAEARTRMEAEDLEFLTVVSPATGKLVGVVLRGALERACASNGHDPSTCILVEHLKKDVDFCFVRDAVNGVLSGGDDGVGMNAGSPLRKRRLRISLPVIVVDSREVPVGLLVR